MGDALRFPHSSHQAGLAPDAGNSYLGITSGLPVIREESPDAADFPAEKRWPFAIADLSGGVYTSKSLGPTYAAIRR